MPHPTPNHPTTPPPTHRISDAAKAVLLHLGRLQNADIQSAAQHVLRPGLTFKNGDVRAPRFSVFLSHKRTDSKDFARALYNLLVLRGISTFLDFEYR